MRKLIIATVAFGLLASPAMADTMKNCGASWKAMLAADQGKTTYKAYSSMCLKSDYKAGGSAMMASPAPAGATGLCKDGTYTMSKTHSGACSHHGGVSKWL